MKEAKALNGASTIEFLKGVEKAYPNKSKIHVFCDNATYYKNKDVTDYLKESKVSLHYLPTYSPNLNPIERLWKLMKEKALYNTYYKQYKDFKGAVLGFFEGLSRAESASEFRKCVRDKFTPIASPIPTLLSLVGNVRSAIFSSLLLNRLSPKSTIPNSLSAHPVEVVSTFPFIIS